MEKALGKQLAELRESKGMTQDELAAKSGVSRPQISRLENDEIESPRYRTLLKLSGALGVQMQVLQPELAAHLAVMPAARRITLGGDVRQVRKPAPAVESEVNLETQNALLRAQVQSQQDEIDRLWDLVKLLGKAPGSSNAASANANPLLPLLSIQRRVSGRAE